MCLIRSSLLLVKKINSTKYTTAVYVLWERICILQLKNRTDLVNQLPVVVDLIDAGFIHVSFPFYKFECHQ